MLGEEGAQWCHISMQRAMLSPRPLLHLFSFPGVLKLVVYFAKIILLLQSTFEDILCCLFS